MASEWQYFVENPHESRSVDFKAGFAWQNATSETKAEICRDLAGIANSGGGMLLIGFEDGTFAPDGKVPEDHGFEMTKIGQYLGERIRPIVKFSVHIDFHRESRYVVLSVREFEHMPHICEKDTPPLRSGDLYYRTERGETTAIRSSDDLNRLLLSAARKYHAWAQAVVGTAADPSATLLAEMERLLESERERFGNG